MTWTSTLNVLSGKEGKEELINYTVDNQCTALYTLFISMQVRDEYRTDYDAGRGGFGKLVQMQRVPEPRQKF